jgi:serine/threonine protein kinase
MAPEILNSKGGSSKSDIFSIGCILYRVITGRKVFDSEKEEVSPANKAFEFEEFREQLICYVPEKFHSFLEMLLQEDPEMRGDSL